MESSLYIGTVFMSSMICLVLALLGRNKKIGVAVPWLIGTGISLLLCTFFTSLGMILGIISTLISVLISPRKDIINPQKISISDEIEKLVKLKTDGVLSNEEFEEQKKRLLS